MPLREPDPQDPMELVGVRLPVAGQGALAEMAECFAEEFIRLGHGRDNVFELFKNPFYVGPHKAYCELGEERIREMINRYDRIFRPTQHGLGDSNV